MKPYPFDLISTRPDVLRSKHMYGMWFGAALGLFFSIFAWGIDAYLLSKINSLYPWLKFLVGGIACMSVGGLTGWLSARWDKPLLSFLLWAVAALIFAWLTIALPIQISPTVLGLMQPEIQGLLHYTYYEGFSTIFGLAYVWIAIFVSLAGLLQIPLSDSAVFSTSILGKLKPMLVTLALMAICGTIVDGLNNELLRSPIDALNSTIQYSIDHRGQEIDRLESRRMHLSALRTIEDLITPERRLIVSGYDEFLEQIQILVRFDKVWAECVVIYNQVSICNQVGNAVP